MNEYIDFNTKTLANNLIINAGKSEPDPPNKITTLNVQGKTYNVKLKPSPIKNNDTTGTIVTDCLNPEYLLVPNAETVLKLQEYGYSTIALDNLPEDFSSKFPKGSNLILVDDNKENIKKNYNLLKKTGYKNIYAAIPARKENLNNSLQQLSDPDQLLYWKARGRQFLDSVCKKIFTNIKNASSWLYEELEEPDPILTGLFDKGTKAWIVAASKARKSFFLLQLALAIAGGKSSILKWDIFKKRKVLLVQVEITDIHYHKRLKNMYKALHIDSALLKDNLLIINGRSCFTVDDVPKVFEEITEIAIANNIELICIDPIYKFLLNENNPEDWKPVLLGLDKLSNDTGAAIISVHHYAKGWSSDKQAIDRASGSGVLARDMDCMINLDRHKDDDLLVIESTQRSYPPLEPFSVRFEDGHFKLDNAAPQLKTRLDNQKTEKPDIADEVALEFFKTGSQPKTAFMEYLKEKTSVRKAKAKFDTLICSGQLKEAKWEGRGKPKLVGLSHQIQEELSCLNQ